MPEVEFREGASSVEAVLDDFDRRRDHFERMCEETVRLIRAILDVKKVKVQAIYGRVKAKDKLKSKYCKSAKDYKRLDDIADLIGLRIITYYSDEIDRIKEIIVGEFEERGPLDDKRTGRPDSFGYSALHMDCAYSRKRLENIELQPFADTRFEIQITTVIGHAWAEMHHAWYDSGDSPKEEERRFHRLAAVLELAEQEFLEIRRKKEQRERSASLQVAAESPDIPITLESLKAFIEQKNIVGEKDEQVGQILGMSLRSGFSPGQLSQMVDLLRGASISTVQELESMLTKASPALDEFVTRCAPIWKAAHSSSVSVSYLRGFSITQLANMLISSRGEDEYNSFFELHPPKIDPSLDLSAQVAIAKEIVEKHRLS
jgi:ppGpp synthetase/RelA/SpoT-type nucleotidyltranferase